MAPTNPNTFYFKFPIYSYVAKPGPTPGYPESRETGAYFAPLWTDQDLFNRFVDAQPKDARISPVTINSLQELIAHLEGLQPLCKYVGFDWTGPGARFGMGEMQRFLGELGYALADQFISSVKERIEVAYASAIKNHLDGVVVFALDVRDTTARQVASLRKSDAEIEAVMQEASALGTVPCVVLPFSMFGAEEVITGLDPGAAGKLKGMPMPKEHFLVVGISRRHVAFRSLPKP